MCGISGFVGIEGYDRRETLVLALGMGIDERGGHGAGYVAIRNGEVSYCRKPGYWISARNKFIARAAAGKTCMMHARWATCGTKHISEAHPFAIKRDGRTKLWGCHNGVIANAWKSAEKRGRSITVDSEEIFELIADGESLSHLQGYGTISWIEADDLNGIYFARLSQSSELYIAKTMCGGYVWGSTPDIVYDATQLADIKIAYSFDTSAIGVAYRLSKIGLMETNRTNLKIGDGVSYWWNHIETDEEDDWNQYWREMYEKDLNAREYDSEPSLGLGVPPNDTPDFSISDEERFYYQMLREGK